MPIRCIQDNLALAAWMLDRAARQTTCYFENAPEMPYTCGNISDLINEAEKMQRRSIRELKSLVAGRQAVEVGIGLFAAPHRMLPLGVKREGD